MDHSRRVVHHYQVALHRHHCEVVVIDEVDTGDQNGPVHLDKLVQIDPCHISQSVHLDHLDFVLADNADHFSIRRHTHPAFSFC